MELANGKMYSLASTCLAILCALLVNEVLGDTALDMGYSTSNDVAIGTICDDPNGNILLATLSRDGSLSTGFITSEQDISDAQISVIRNGLNVPSIPSLSCDASLDDENKPMWTICYIIENEELHVTQFINGSWTHQTLLSSKALECSVQSAWNSNIVISRAASGYPNRIFAFDPNGGPPTNSSIASRLRPNFNLFFDNDVLFTRELSDGSVISMSDPSNLKVISETSPSFKLPAVKFSASSSVTIQVNDYREDSDCTFTINTGWPSIEGVTPKYKLNRVRGDFLLITVYMQDFMSSYLFDWSSATCSKSYIERFYLLLTTNLAISGVIVRGNSLVLGLTMYQPAPEASMFQVTTSDYAQHLPPTSAPSTSPSKSPSINPTTSPSISPTKFRSPTTGPTSSPTISPSSSPSYSPTQATTSPTPAESTVSPAPSQSPTEAQTGHAQGFFALYADSIRIAASVLFTIVGLGCVNSVSNILMYGDQMQRR